MHASDVTAPCWLPQVGDVFALCWSRDSSATVQFGGESCHVFCVMWEVTIRPWVSRQRRTVPVAPIRPPSIGTAADSRLPPSCPTRVFALNTCQGLLSRQLSNRACLAPFYVTLSSNNIMSPVSCCLCCDPIAPVTCLSAFVNCYLLCCYPVQPWSVAARVVRSPVSDSPSFAVRLQAAVCVLLRWLGQSQSFSDLADLVVERRDVGRDDLGERKRQADHHQQLTVECADYHHQGVTLNTRNQNH